MGGDDAAVAATKTKAEKNRKKKEREKAAKKRKQEALKKIAKRKREEEATATAAAIEAGEAPPEKKKKKVKIKKKDKVDWTPAAGDGAQGEGAQGAGGVAATLYVTNIPYTAKESKIGKHFDGGGATGKHVVGVRIPLDKDGKSRGICFVDFNSSDAASRALKLDGSKLQGRELAVVMSTSGNEGAGKQTGAQPEGCRTLFVKNLDYKYEPKELRKALGKKHVKEVRPFVDRETGEQKGMAYVEFNDEKGAAEGTSSSRTLDHSRTP